MTTFARSAPDDDFGDLSFDEDDIVTSTPSSASSAAAETGTGQGSEARPELPVVDARVLARQRVLGLTDQMVAVFKDPSRSDLDRLPELHDLANQIYLVAHSVHMKILSRAAFLFYSMTDRLRLAKKWDGAAVAVFIEALRRLEAAEDDSPLSDRIHDGLKRVANRANPYLVH